MRWITMMKAGAGESVECKKVFNILWCDMVLVDIILLQSPDLGYGCGSFDDVASAAVTVRATHRLEPNIIQ